MWLDIVIVALFIFAGYAFIRLIGFQTGRLSRRTKRTAESMYPNYADSPRQQHQYAKEHGGTWSEDDGGERR